MGPDRDGSPPEQPPPPDDAPGRQLDDRARHRLLQHAVSAAGVGTFDWDLLSDRLIWDERMLEMFGYRTEEFDQTIHDFTDRLHPTDRERVMGQVRRAIDDCGEFEVEYRVSRDGAEPRWVHGRGKVLCDETGTGVRLLGAAWDVTAGHVARRAAEAATRRTELLSAVTAELTEHLDADVAVARLARLVVPTLADWCIVTLVDDHAPAGSLRGLREVACWHADPELLPVVERYSSTRLGAAGIGAFVRQALSSSRPVVIPGDATRAIRAMLAPGDAVEGIWELAPRHAVLFPLRARGGTVGVLSLFRGTESPEFGPEDMATAVDVAGRAGMALDNGRLFRQQRDVAQTLQLAMLTPPPEPDHLEVAVRYTPAAQAAQIGGDWYDAFLQPGGATVMVIGDVVGHDYRSAAVMGQIRTIVRALGARADLPPAELLAEADRVLHTLRLNTAATAVAARLEQSPAERELGLTRLRWSNAGHPPPLVLHDDGRVELLAGDGVDLLLGIRADASRRDQEVVLRRGSMVLLYTDGLIERRDRPLDVGLQALQRAVAELGAGDLERMCDGLLAGLLPESPQDDVALVAVRLHPERPETNV